jgi:fructose-bisphosphate aldolase class II
LPKSLISRLLALLTSASDAEDFLATGIDILAPSIGNIHGDYGPLGPQLDYDRLSSISEQVKGRAEVALHGTNDFTPAIMQECIDRGAIKLNINKLILEQWSIFFRENAAKLSLTDLMDGGMNVLQAQVEKWMNICGSVGKA